MGVLDTDLVIIERAGVLHKADVSEIRTTSASSNFKFWLADESQVCIDLDQNKLPFWLADETYSPIDLGCP